MVRRVPEIGYVPGIADRFRIFVGNYRGIYNLVVEPGSQIDEVYAVLAMCRSKELSGMAIGYDVDVRGLFKDKIVDKKTAVIFGKSVEEVVHPRAGIVISHHHPELIRRIGGGEDGMVADILHLLAAIFVSLIEGGARLLVLCPEGPLLWPGVESDNIYLLPSDIDACPSGAVGHDTVRLGSRYAFDVLYRIL